MRKRGRMTLCAAVTGMIAILGPFPLDSIPLIRPNVWQNAWAGSAQITTGGEIRARGEYNDNMDFDKNIDDLQSFVGQRSRVNLDVNAGEVQGFIQLQDTRNWGEDSNTAPATGFDDTGRDLQATDLRQAYVLIHNFLGFPVAVQYGRQVLSYGDERLIGGFDWSNFSRAYDGIKISYAASPVDVDLFTAKLKEAGSGTDSNISGLYAATGLIPRNNLQVYYLADTGSGGNRESTLGARVNGRWNALDYTGEYANQFGDVSNTVNRDAQAYALAAGYTLSGLFGGLRIGAEYDFATGDDTVTSDNESFNNLYPTNHPRYGLNDNGNNWSDIKALAVTLKVEPVKGLWCKLEYWNLQRDTGTGKEGTEINLQSGYAYSDNLDLLVQLMHFAPDAASGDDPQQLAVLQSTFKF